MEIEKWEKELSELNAKHEEKMKKAKLEIGQQFSSIQELRRKMKMPVHSPKPEDMSKKYISEIENLEEEHMLLRMKVRRRIPKYTEKEVREIMAEADMSSRQVRELAN